MKVFFIRLICWKGDIMTKRIWIQFKDMKAYRENEKGTMQLSDAEPCSAAASAFYDRYRTKLCDIGSTAQRNDILSAMQQDFEEEVRRNPQERNELSEIYELLKIKCCEV